MAKKYFFINAAICWLVAVVINVLCIAGVNVADNFKGVWIMHLGVFPVWIYAIMYLRKRPDLANYSQRDDTGKRKSPLAFLKLLVTGMPVWVMVLAVICMYYPVVNFFLSLHNMGGTPVAEGGVYMLQEHGKIIKTLTLQEYNYAQSQQLRLFSGHWVGFYGLAAAVLYPEIPKSSKGDFNSQQMESGNAEIQ